MIEAPSLRSGSSFCTVNRAPFTLMSNERSKPSSVRVPRGDGSAMPAFTKRMSARPLVSLTVAARRSRSASLETSPWTAVTLRPMAFVAGSISLSRRPARTARDHRDLAIEICHVGVLRRTPQATGVPSSGLVVGPPC